MSSEGIDIVEAMRGHVYMKYGSRKEAAKAWGVTVGNVSHVLNGRQGPSQEMLNDAGITRRVTYHYKTENPA